MLNPPRILASGDAAVTVEFGKTIDDASNARVLTLDRAIAEAKLPWVAETVPTYRSLLVHYRPAAISFAELSNVLLHLSGEQPQTSSGRRRWRVPVVYGGDFGADLEDVARAHKITTDDVVRLHSGGDYRVAMIGFTPGFRT